jgi:diaminohydroxyphosphoribosylaminopyrimidine deaminase/5-amino-6-(5-phosphoribosylamino)uracil reductase
MIHHDIYIARCFQIAQLGRGFTRSNPLVGAIFVHNNTIVSEGYHREYGGPHAEVNCLKSIHDSEILSEGTLYVSLEPCCHVGKTPACTDLIIEKGIRKLVIGSSDFNAVVREKSMALLEKHGIEVLNLNRIEQQQRLNPSFYINQTQHRPYFKAKIAMSHDEFIGRDGERIKITSEEMDFWSHRQRAASDAILIGRNTWNIDSPKLDARLYSDAKPDIIILSHGAMENIAARPNQTIININAEKDHRAETTTWVKSDVNLVKSISETIYKLGYRNILIEGGTKIIQSFLSEHWIDEMTIIKNEALNLGHGIQAPTIEYSQFGFQSIYCIQSQQSTTYQRRDLFNS